MIKTRKMLVAEVPWYYLVSNMKKLCDPSLKMEFEPMLTLSELQARIGMLSQVTYLLFCMYPDCVQHQVGYMMYSTTRCL